MNETRLNNTNNTNNNSNTERPDMLLNTTTGANSSKSSRTSIQFITNENDQQKNEINDDPMDEDLINPEMNLKEFLEIYLTGPLSIRKNIDSLINELILSREQFDNAKNELTNSKSDISVIHSLFFESRRNYDNLTKELNDSKIESELLKNEIRQLRLESTQQLREISFKLDHLSRIILQQQIRPGQANNNTNTNTNSNNNSQINLNSNIPFYPPPPPPHFIPNQLTINSQQLPPVNTNDSSIIVPPNTTQQIKTEFQENYPQQQPLPPPQQNTYMTREFNRDSNEMINSDRIMDSSTVSSPQDETPRNFKYSLLKQITSIRQIWQEYAYGLNGQPSIKSLQIKYKTKWRYPEDASTFKRRKRIYKAIEIAMLNGLTEDEAIIELENHRLDKEGNYRRSLQWLYDNIPNKFKGA